MRLRFVIRNMVWGLLLLRRHISVNCHLIFYSIYIFHVYLTHLVQPFLCEKVLLFPCLFEFPHFDPHSVSLFVENIKIPLRLEGKISEVMLKLQSSTTPDLHSRPIVLGALITLLKFDMPILLNLSESDVSFNCRGLIDRFNLFLLQQNLTSKSSHWFVSCISLTHINL